MNTNELPSRTEQEISPQEMDGIFTDKFVEQMREALPILERFPMNAAQIKLLVDELTAEKQQ